MVFSGLAVILVVIIVFSGSKCLLVSNAKSSLCHDAL